MMSTSVTAATMEGELARLVEELDAITSEARAAFGRLSAAQINWKPSPERWSVGQCFEHLLKTNEGFLSALELVNRGGYRATLWQRLSPLSGFFGGLVLRAIEKGRKAKASAAISPSSSGVGADIVERFATHQGAFARLIAAARADELRCAVVASPIVGFVTYTLFDACRIAVAHERRHFEQARRVTETEGFPTA